MVLEVKSLLFEGEMRSQLYTKRRGIKIKATGWENDH